MSLWTPPWTRGALGAAKFHSLDKSGIRWMVIPAGTTNVFSPKYGRFIPISVPRPFLASQTAVTQEQYERVMGRTTFASPGADHPADSVVYGGADGFCQRIGARLPNEREWVYMTMAGAPPEWAQMGVYGPADDIAWHAGNSGGHSHPVGRKEPNSLGLYDMLGNVAHWTTSTDDGGRTRRAYGASFASPVNMVAATTFFAIPHRTDSPSVGFRCVMDYTPETSRVQFLEMEEMSPTPPTDARSDAESRRRVTALELDGLRGYGRRSRRR